MPHSAENRQARQKHGVVVLNKPAGPSSAQCLRAFKRQGQKKLGHAGTLDPMADGVLLVLLGNATKLSSWLLANGKKVYAGSLRLGLETDTWDITGQKVCEKAWRHLREADIAAALSGWTELREQAVPAFSAAKYNGQPLYKLARKGHDTPVKVKSVSIASAELLAFNPPFVDFRVACGSGVYIRSLAHSLGMRLGCGACLSQLTREYSHPFGLDQALSLDEIENGLDDGHVRPIASALPDWPFIELNEQAARAVRNGLPVPAEPREQGPYAILGHGGRELALASLEEGGARSSWRVLRGLWTEAD